MNNILPNGTELRDLLSQSFLTTSHLNKLLKDKGVITQNSDRNASFPVYMSILLSPDEFNYLYSMNNIKEGKEKIKTVVIPINENIDLADFCLDINIDEILKDKLTYQPNYEVVGSPNFVISNNEIILDVNIISTSNIKGWSSRESSHSASLSIKKENDNLIVTKIFTSKDSEKVIDFAFEDYEEKLTANNYVKKDKKISRILFGDFKNENRFGFFYSFANDFKNVMQFEEITDIDILPDNKKSAKLPVDLKDFLNNVNNLSLKGKKLQNHIFITQKENHQFIQLKSIKFKYRFDKLGCDGTCVIEFEFPDKKNMDISEFQFNISNLSIDKKDKELVTNSVISKKINTVLNKHKLEKYEVYKNQEV